MAITTAKVEYKIEDYKAEIHNDWCPGCGDFGILAALQMALAKLQIPPYRVALVSGIGCSSKLPHYMQTYVFHTLHGRIMPAMTGLKLANHTLTVIGVGGDGDAYGIGAGHFVNGGRRNLDITYIVCNNNVYALTKGQASPTIPKGQKTKSMTAAAITEAINPVALALACGYTFVARGYALDVKYLADLIAQGIQHKGSALIDVLQTCPTYNDLYSKAWYEGKKPEQAGWSPLFRLDHTDYDPLVHDPSNRAEIAHKKAQAILKSEEGDRLALGLFYKCEVPTYEDYLEKKGQLRRDKPPAENPDLSPLLDALT